MRTWLLSCGKFRLDWAILGGRWAESLRSPLVFAYRHSTELDMYSAESAMSDTHSEASEPYLCFLAVNLLNSKKFI